jgi:hypothetical protein
MSTITRKIKDLIDNNDSPIPLAFIPNQMGINLCSVDSITWTRQTDGQLVNVTINFIPNQEI